MTERQMFEKSFQRPSDYFTLPPQRQWEIDKDLGKLKEEFNKYFHEPVQCPS